MERHDRLGVLQRQGRSDDRTPVTALNAIAFIAQCQHQPVQTVRDPAGMHARVPWCLRETETRERGNDQVETRLLVDAGSEERSGLHELHERARPTVDQEERQALFRPRPGIQHRVKLFPIDRPAYVGQLVQSPLLCEPVVVLPPVADEVAQHGIVGASLPSFVDRDLRPAGLVDPPMQVSDHPLAEGDPERQQGHELGGLGEKRERHLAMPLWCQLDTQADRDLLGWDIDQIADESRSFIKLHEHGCERELADQGRGGSPGTRTM